MDDWLGIVSPKEGDTVSFQATGAFQLRGKGEVRGVTQIQDYDGRLVTAYLLWAEVPGQEPGWMVIGEGELARPGRVLH